MRRYRLPPFQNVAANQTAVLPVIPQGPTFHQIILELGGTFTKAHVTAIRVRLAGKLIVDVTGSHLDDMNEYMGETANANYLTIPFADPHARTIDGEEIGAIETQNAYTSFSMEVDIGGATSPTLKAYAVVSDQLKAIPEHRGLFRALLKAVQSPAASGDENLNVPLGSKAGTLIKRVHLFHANVTQLDVKRDGVFLQDNGETAIVQYDQNAVSRVTQSGHFVFDPLVRDNQSDAVPTARPDGESASFEFIATVSGADTITMYSELYASIDRL